jgi:hypothetical protein
MKKLRWPRLQVAAFIKAKWRKTSTEDYQRYPNIPET